MSANASSSMSMMRTALKGVSVPVAAACLLSAVLAVAGTAAYLTSASSDVNVFALGQVRVELSESDTGIDADGDPSTNSYEISPGATVAKNPAVKVPEGSAACWVFVELDRSANLLDFVGYEVDGDVWTPLEGYDGIWYRKVAEDEAGRSLPVLKDDKVQVKDAVTWAQLAELERAVAAGEAKRPTLTVTAYAVQSAGIDDAEQAWARIAGAGE